MKLLISLIFLGVVSGGKDYRPCGEENVVDCLCADGKSYTSRTDVIKHCDKNENPVEFCNCGDGFKWIPKSKPCDEANVVDCLCEDGETYIGKAEVRENCRRRDNPIRSCNCDDGIGWAPPRKPCGSKGNIKDCLCEDGKSYEGHAEVKENCKRRYDNPPKSCNCQDGSIWTRPEKPCGGKAKKNINECTCKDGSTCKPKTEEACRKTCNRRKNPIQNCSCKDGTTWNRD